MKTNPTVDHSTNRRGVSLCLLPSPDHSALDDLLREISHQDERIICLDLCCVSYLSPAHIRTLGGFAESFQRRGGFLRLENVSGSVTRVAQVMGFGGLLGVPPAPDAALRPTERAKK